MTHSDFSVLAGRGPNAGSLRRGPSGTGHHYDPNQPRVPAGDSDGGQWTSTGGATTSRQDDEGVVSDAMLDNEWKPGAQYAIRRAGGRGGAAPPTPGQLARLASAEARARAAVREVHERDPRWRPQPSIYETVEGRINATQAVAEQAAAYLAELITNGIGPGPLRENRYQHADRTGISHQPNALKSTGSETNTAVIPANKKSGFDAWKLGPGPSIPQWYEPHYRWRATKIISALFGVQQTTGTLGEALGR